MKGAITDPWAAMSNEPKATITMMIGASHSFLRTRRKTNNSLIKFIKFSKLILERFTSWAGGNTLNPIGIVVRTFQTEFVAAK